MNTLEAVPAPVDQARERRKRPPEEVVEDSEGTAIMKDNHQDRVCAFVRAIIAARTGETVELTDQPELEHRNIPAVDELWQSASHPYAVEHTRIESFAPIRGGRV